MAGDQNRRIDRSPIEHTFSADFAAYRSMNSLGPEQEKRFSPNITEIQKKIEGDINEIFEEYKNEITSVDQASLPIIKERYSKVINDLMTKLGDVKDKINI